MQNKGEGYIKTVETENLSFKNGGRSMRGAQVLCESLLREGTEVIFGYPGGAVLNIYDELKCFEGRLRHILCRHEQGAVHMAEGYALATGRTGVALAWTGNELVSLGGAVSGAG